MNTPMKSTIITFTLLLYLWACKPAEPQIDFLQGDWIEVERYDGYLFGGNYEWNPVPDSIADILKMDGFGNLTQIRPNGSTCEGRYFLELAESQLYIYGDCFFREKNLISQDEPDEFVYHKPVIEGIVRYRFKRMN